MILLVYSGAPQNLQTPSGKLDARFASWCTSGARRGRRGSLAPSDVERGHRSIVLELAYQCIRLHLLDVALNPRRRPHIAALLGAERDLDACVLKCSSRPPPPKRSHSHAFSNTHTKLRSEVEAVCRVRAKRRMSLL